MARTVTAAVLVALAAGAIAASFALLSWASSSNDPVGKLTPRAHLPAAPADVIRPQTGPIEREGADD